MPEDYEMVEGDEDLWSYDEEAEMPYDKRYDMQEAYMSSLNQFVKFFHDKKIKVKVNGDIGTLAKWVKSYNNEFAQPGNKLDGINNFLRGQSISDGVFIKALVEGDDNETFVFRGNTWRHLLKKAKNIVSDVRLRKKLKRIVFMDLQGLMKIRAKSLQRIKKMDLLAFGAIITSQGIPFLAEGDDFGRTKHLAEDSFNNIDPSVNPLDWGLKSINNDMYKFYQGMIKLRKAHPAFRMHTKEMVDKHLHFLHNIPDNMIAYVLKDNANGDAWENILVVLNSSPYDQTLEIVGRWNVVVSGDKAGTDMLKLRANKIRGARC